MVDPIGGVVTWKRVAARKLNATTGSGRRRAVASERFFGRVLVVTTVNARGKNGDLADDRNARETVTCSANAFMLPRNGDVSSQCQRASGKTVMWLMTAGALRRKGEVANGC